LDSKISIKYLGPFLWQQPASSTLSKLVRVAKRIETRPSIHAWLGCDNFRPPKTGLRTFNFLFQPRRGTGMDNTDQVAEAVEALVRLQLVHGGQSNGDRMELDEDPDAADEQQEAKLKAAQEYCLRILGRYIHTSDLTITPQYVCSAKV
jgi:hypothetical protein